MTSSTQQVSQASLDSMLTNLTDSTSVGSKPESSFSKPTFQWPQPRLFSCPCEWLSAAHTALLIPNVYVQSTVTQDNFTEVIFSGHIVDSGTLLQVLIILLRLVLGEGGGYRNEWILEFHVKLTVSLNIPSRSFQY